MFHLNDIKIQVRISFIQYKTHLRIKQKGFVLLLICYILNIEMMSQSLSDLYRATSQRKI